MEPPAMCLFLPIRYVRTALIAATIVIPSVSAFGQNGPPSLAASLEVAAAQAASQAEPSGPVHRLTMDDAVKLGLEQNLGIRIQRLDPQIQDLGIATARSLWTPNLTSSLSRNSANTPVQGAILPSTQSGTLAAGVGMNQVLPWGGSYNATWSNQRVTTTDITRNYSPQLTSTLNLGYTQPLIRNLSIDQIRDQVQLSQKARDLSDIQLQAVIMGTTRNVRNAYWDLATAIANLKAQQQSLELSQQSLTDNKRRVEIGTLAPIDIVQAQAEVASNEAGVITAEAAIKTAQDNLRALVLDPGQADFWNVIFEPTDEATFAEQSVDVDSAVRGALEKRTDILAAKNSLEQSDVNLKFYHNQIMPQVNLQANYGAISYGGVQLSPVNLTNLGGALPPRSIISQRGYGSVLGDVFTNAYPQWTFGVQVGYPLGASTVQANLARTKLQYEQAQAQIKNIELQVVTQVRLAARNVQTNLKLVQSARASR